ncbi:AAA family ATPase [Gephyromycinifex aptenodytis]|uniref:AAA family ATPase n=1 Tax=Gephyromycinifex aptenodytis TaxID=2716227 RepID=UPI001448758A|nr:ATP-binding protein [Gephyromycinifex aptenodytis]
MSEELGWFAYAPMSGQMYRPDAPAYSSSVHMELDDAPDPGRRPELADLGRLARRGLRGALKVARAEEALTPGALVRSFLGEIATDAEILEETWASYEGVNMQTALDAWLGQQGRQHRCHGIQSMNEDASLTGMLFAGDNPFSARLASISRSSLPSGPDGATLSCVRYGLYLVETDEGDTSSRVVLFSRLAMPEHGRPRAGVEILAADRAAGERIAAALRALSRELNVFRGQVLTFGGDMFDAVDSILSFHRRPAMTRGDLILDDDKLAAIERQVVGIARHREALLNSGQHLKRGLLLYGPPGVGKTHTVRYLISTLRDVTVIQVSGGALGLIAEACSAARALAPSIVVVEDVDLIAEDRGMHPGEHPLLFQLLNEMDGIEEDCDVAFVLTTNRADLLEPALAARPGRIDEAVEIDLPDLEARRRLFELYRGTLQLDASTERIEAVLQRAQGVTASFLKELLRRSALQAAERGEAAPHPGALLVTADDLDAALDGLLDTRSRMTRTLLGSAPADHAVTNAETHPVGSPTGQSSPAGVDGDIAAG